MALISCPECKNKVSDSATSCPKCGTPITPQIIADASKKKVNGVGIYIFVFLVFLVLCFIFFTPSSSHHTEALPPAGISDTGRVPVNQIEDKEEKKTDKAIQAKIGDAVSVGGFVFKVENIMYDRFLGSTYFNKTADGVYLIIKIVIANNTKESHVIDSSLFTLCNDQGIKYDYSHDGSSALELGMGGKTLFLKQCQPGIPTSGYLVFEVPAKGTYHLKVRGSFWDSETGDIILSTPEVTPQPPQPPQQPQHPQPLQPPQQTSKTSGSRYNVPQFTDYPSDAVYIGTNHPLFLDEFGKSYRTRLREAIKNGKPDFAGHYIVVKWGCGSSGCNTGAVIDSKTGKAYLFPVAMSSVFPLKPEFEQENGQEHIYKLNSRLMVFAGNLEGTKQGDGVDTVEFYEFKNDQFLYIKSIPYNHKGKE